MTSTRDPDTEQLIRLARKGDSSTANRLIGHFRARLRRMIGVRMDRRLANRLDPSDVVQDALAEAHRLLPEYLHVAPLQPEQRVV